jgi:glycosyltransferase involved in cell wall biosynthesis
MASAFTFILPAHNEEKGIERSVRRIAERLGDRPGTEVVIAENGSSDATWEIAQRLARETKEVRVFAYREENAGLGYALQRALEEMLREHPLPENRWLVLTGAELPVGFTDLDAVLRIEEEQPDALPDVIIGSKAHRDSKIDNGATRRIASSVYRLARFAILGMHTGDSQGMFFIRQEVARPIVPRVRARDFFWTTEFTYYLEQAGCSIVEVPVALEQARRASTVRPFKHGSRMFRQLLALRASSRG